MFANIYSRTNHYLYFWN